MIKMFALYYSRVGPPGPLIVGHSEFEAGHRSIMTLHFGKEVFDSAFEWVTDGRFSKDELVLETALNMLEGKGCRIISVMSLSRPHEDIFVDDSGRIENAHKVALYRIVTRAKSKTCT